MSDQAGGVAPDIVVAIEPTWTGNFHAASNASTLQIVAKAFPETPIRVLAEASHLDALAIDSNFSGLAQVATEAIDLHPQYRFRPHIVSLGRGRAELAMMRRALAPLAGRRVLMFLMSATSTALAAASLLCRASRRELAVQAVLHGNLAEAALDGWRPRNPLVRWLDMPTMLEAGHPERLRFIVLEPAIRDALARRMPCAAARTDVLPLPVQAYEIPDATPPAFAPPLRFGFVGQATEAKGIDAFLDLARRAKTRHGDRVGFDIIGRAQPGTDLAQFADVAEAITHEHLSRAEFTRRLAALHFVVLPFREGYYTFSASGALIDAVTWAKPFIATRLPIAEQWFERYGDVGYLCPDTASIAAVIDEIVLAQDADRYAAQAARLEHARADRLPDALARDYRAITRRLFA